MTGDEFRAWRLENSIPDEKLSFMIGYPVAAIRDFESDGWRDAPLPPVVEVALRCHEDARRVR